MSSQSSEASSDSETAATSDALLQRVVELCQERRGEDIRILDVRDLVEYMDYMVIVTGRSGRQNRAIAEHVLTGLKREHGVLPLSKAVLDGGAWICLDFVDVVLHVFDVESRKHYDLELLWADAKLAAVQPPASIPSDEDA